MAAMKSQHLLALHTVVRMRRSMLSLVRKKVVSVDHVQELELEEFDHFQSHVAARFRSLLPSSAHKEGGPGEGTVRTELDQQLLSLAFLEKLLGVFLLCEEEFRALLVLVLARDPAMISMPPVNRLVSGLLDQAVKALDICNAVIDAISCLQHRLRHADIAASAVQQQPGGSQRPPCQGQLNRATRALTNLLGSMPTNAKTERAWSLDGARVRNNINSSYVRNKSEGHLQTSVSRNWSASKQLQAMAAGLALPRCPDTGAGGSLVLAVQTMTSVLVFTMWALVAALPCQDRANAPGTPPVVPPPSQLAWTAPLAALQHQITEEWKKKDKRCSAGLLAELQGMEKSARGLLERVAGKEGCQDRAEELAEASRKLGEGMGPLQSQVREVFQRVKRSRVEVQQLLEQCSRSSIDADSSDLERKDQHRRCLGC